MNDHDHEPTSTNQATSADEQQRSAFDADGAPVLYRTANGAWVCATCLGAGPEPVDVLPRSGGVLGRCDACRELDESPAAPSCRDLAEWLRFGLLSMELDPVWAELLGQERGAARPEGPPRGIEVRVGEAVFRCVVERLR